MSLEEVKALANPLRLRILRELARRPSYPKELARRLGVSEQLVYYHVGMLERAGLVKVVGLSEVRGATAKRYAVCRDAIVVRLREPAPAQGEELPDPVSRLVEEGGIIVVGSPDAHGPLLGRARDQYIAIDLGIYLGSFTRRFRAKLDTELKERDYEENLICVGGPTVNTLTWRVNRYLPIYFDMEHENRIVSRLSGRTYSEDVDGVVEFIESPFCEGRMVVVLAGRRIEGTRASVVAFTSRLAEVAEGNVHDRRVRAHVVEGLDKDSDGLIDDVEVLE